MYDKERKKLEALVGKELWNLLKENNCFIAGGAITSIFTNKEVNDVDVYFQSAEEFTEVIQAIFDIDGKRTDYDLEYKSAVVNHVSGKAVLILGETQQKIQLIAHQFYPNAPEIFNTFDFTINMGAYDMQNEMFWFHPEFFKHLAQRYLQVNTNTSYPLISVLRVDKYRQRGYNISKAQMLRLLLAVNRKNIDSWQKLADELGGMYGTMPEEIFDYSKPFNLQEAIDRLDEIEIKEVLYKNSPTYNNVVTTMPWAFTADAINAVKKDLEENLIQYNKSAQISYYSGWYDKDIEKTGKLLLELESFN